MACADDVERQRHVRANVLALVRQLKGKMSRIHALAESGPADPRQVATMAILAECNDKLDMILRYQRAKDARR